MKITTYIRWILSILLVYGIYTETGIWTMIAFILIVGENEVKTLVKEHAKHARDSTSN